MLLHLLGNMASAQEFSGRIPSILIARRTFSGPVAQYGQPAMAPLFLENLFSEKSLPIMLDHNGVQAHGQSHSVTHDHTPSFTGLRTLEDRVKDNKPETVHNPHAPMRIRISRMAFVPNNKIRPNQEALGFETPEPVRGEHPLLKFILALMVIAGIIAVSYHCGKINESRNYVRVPATN